MATILLRRAFAVCAKKDNGGYEVRQEDRNKNLLIHSEDIQLVMDGRAYRDYFSTSGSHMDYSANTLTMKNGDKYKILDTAAEVQEKIQEAERGTTLTYQRPRPVVRQQSNG